MKLFFISDIHGSYYFLKQALERFKEEQADYIVILGDELYHGARNPLPPEYNPKEVTALLNGYADKIIAIRGNCDSEVDEMVLDYPIMSTYSTIFFDGRRLFLTHGHVYNESRMPALQKGDAFFYGHTHVPKAEKQDGIFILNPGSVSMPKEGATNSYGVLENDNFSIKDLNGKTFLEIEFD